MSSDEPQKYFTVSSEQLSYFNLAFLKPVPTPDPLSTKQTDSYFFLCDDVCLYHFVF
jgi:hypothetical protein